MNKIKMFKTFILSGLFLLIVSANAIGQEWYKLYDPISGGAFKQMTETPDGFLWIKGNGCFSGDCKREMIYKLDKSGSVIFRKDIFEHDAFNTDLSLLIPTNENGIYFTSKNAQIINKMSASGDLLWSKEFKNEHFSGIDSVYNVTNHFKKTKDDGIIVSEITYIYSKKGTDSSRLKVILFDKTGNEIWVKLLNRAIPILELKDSSFVVSWQLKTLNGNGSTTLFDEEISFSGKIFKEEIKFFDWENNKNMPFDIEKISDNNYIGYNKNPSPNSKEFVILKFKDTNFTWRKVIYIDSFSPSYVFEDKNKNIIILGTEQLNKPILRNRLVAMALDSLGKIIAFNRYEPKNPLRNNYFAFMHGIGGDSESFYICGAEDSGNLSDRQPMLIKASLNKINRSISGKVIIDDVQNCIKDTSELALKNILIKAQNEEGDLFYVYPLEDKRFEILLYGDSIVLTTESQFSYYQQLCTPSVIVFDSTTQTIQKDLFLQKTLDCPYLTTNIANFALRPCFDATQVVNFCNYGTATAQNAYVEVQLDPNLTYQSSSIAAINLGNGKYRFNLGDLPIDSCGQFTILTKVACDNSLLGKTLCSKVHIYPDSLCNQDLGKIKVNGTCNNTTIQFDIKNESDKAMSADKNYIIIEDVVMFKQGTFKLNANETLPIQINAQPGKTYRLIAEQTNPIYGSLATTAFENCNASASPSTGFINQFAQGDDSPFEDIDCRVVTASYDPNDKQAVPQGVQNQHYIAKNTDLEYMIRFQNKGTDTAFTVIIKDTLSQYLDPATIVPGVSSHPYRFDLTDKGIAKFIFSNIQLPHQKVNDEGSNGFVKFRIKQQRDLPNGNVIKNKAAIYFDFNDPIITNETFHTIGENWLMIIPIKEVNKEAIEVKIYPNPFSQSTTIELEGEYNDLTFNVFDVNGRLLRSEKFNGNRLNFERNGLDGGMYIYDILTENQSLQKGKIVIF